MEVINYERANRGKVIGYVDVKLGKNSGMIVRRIAHLQSGERKWFNFPTFSVEMPGGKPKFAPYFSFELEVHNGEFFEKLSPLVKEYCEKNNIEDLPELEMESLDQLPF